MRVFFFCIVLGHFWAEKYFRLCPKTRSRLRLTTPWATLYLFTVENPPEAEIQPRHLPHAAVHRAAWSGDGGLSGAQLGHRGSAVAPARPQVPQRVSVGSQWGTAGHPGGAQYVAPRQENIQRKEPQTCRFLTWLLFFCEQTLPMDGPFGSTTGGSYGEFLL